jgi:hypothetical protein
MFEKLKIKINEIFQINNIKISIIRQNFINNYYRKSEKSFLKFFLNKPEINLMEF